MDEIERLREELANVRQSALQFDEERDRLRDKLVEVRAELAEANARRNDMRTALEWANGERDEARAKLEQCEKTKNGYVKQLDALSTAVTDALVKRIEPRLSRHPVTVVQHAGSVIGSIATVMGCEPDDGDDLVEAVRLLVAERDRLRERCETLANNHEYRVEELAARRDEHKAKREEYAAEARSLRERLKDAYREHDEARAEVERLRIALLEVQTSESAPAWFADGFHDGWKAGAEAMREACAMLVLTSNAVHGRVDADALRALPVPEDK